MKTIFYTIATAILLLVIITKCGGSIEDSPEFKKTRIETNVLDYLKNNRHSLEVQNFEFIYNNVSKQMLCPYDLRKLINVTNEEASVSIHFGNDKSQGFLTEHSEKGRLQMYGIKFRLNGEEVEVETSKYVFNDKYMETKKHLNLKELVNKPKFENLDFYYNTEMKMKQIANKQNCR